jgi:hypothetical protein
MAPLASVGRNVDVIINGTSAVGASGNNSTNPLKMLSDNKELKEKKHVIRWPTSDFSSINLVRISLCCYIFLSQDCPK